jgi:hypothetical protein
VSSRRGQVLVGVILAAVLFALFLRGVDTAQLLAALRAADPLALASVVPLTLASYAVRGWRWGALLQPMAQIKVRDLFSATMVGFAASLVIPRSGEFLRPWLVSRRHPVKMSAGFATIVIERLIDLISVLALFSLYLFVLPRPAAQTSGGWVTSLQVGGAFAMALALVLLALLLALHANAEGTVRFVDRLLSHGPSWLSVRVGQVLRSFSDGLAVLRAPGSHWLLIAVQSALLWLLTAASLHLVQVAFAIDLPFHTSFLLIAFLVVGESIPTPGLVGGFHAFYLLALAEVFGVERNLSVAAGIAAHALTNLPVLVVGAALLGRESLSFGQVAEVTRAEPLR